jgi:periodic tryptophan protein 1
MVLATTWVRRGVAAQFPTKYEIDEAELGRISKLAKLQLEDAQNDLNIAQGTTDDDTDAEDTSDVGKPSNGTAIPLSHDDDDLAEYNLDDYDDEPADEQGQKFAMFGNANSLAYHAPNEEDPYLVLPEGEDEDEEEREELQILPEDNLLLAAKVEDEVAHLEVYVYEDAADNLYVHHDIMLPAIPLCVEWIDIPVGTRVESRANGNFVAVGTMSPEIEIWDLDVVDNMYPNAVLGQTPEESADIEGKTRTKKKKKKGKSKPKSNDSYHVDAVLALAANRQHRNLLASASADETVKLWDLSTAKCAKSYSMHKGKVCALDWHPNEGAVLLSGSYDRTVAATDMRAPDVKAPRWTVEADVEKVRWNTHDSNFFYVTTESGAVYYYDARSIPSEEGLSKAVWTLQAHNGAVSAFDINPTVPGFLATGSDDKQVKLWNVSDNRPNMVVSRNLDVGRVFSAQFAPDIEVGFRLSVAGSNGGLQVWDTSTNAAVRRAFSGKVKMPEGDIEERMVRVNDDGSGDEDGDGGDGEDGGVEMGED